MSSLSEYRSMKDTFYKTSAQSPLTAAQRKTFVGLRYFDESPALRFTLPLERYDNPQTVHMATSTGHVADFLQYARVQFSVNGEPQELQIYRGDGQDELFVPFMDATTGDETYATGRYLDVPERLDGTIILDFNQAYNPYCAYDPERWSCPLPPKENRLNVRIEAGEKVFEALDQ
jgi:uncharacterized protein (DUF1684 family)